jgi:glycosyltransferase involved in cell wall biosynthesis
MRLVLLTEYFYPDTTGSTGTLLSQLTRHLRDRCPELEIEVITGRHCYGASSALPPTEDWDGIAIHRLATPRSNRSSTLQRLACGLLFTGAALHHLMARPRPDMVMVVTNPPTLPLAARGFRRLTGTPYCYLVHDLYPDIAAALGLLPGDSRVAKLFRRCQKTWLHAASRTIVLGRCMADHLVTNYGLERERVAIVPNWADPEQVFPIGRQTRFRSEQQLRGFVLLYAGNLGRHQDFDTLLDAARLLQGGAGSGPPGGRPRAYRRPRPPAFDAGGCRGGAAQEITFVLVGDGAKRQHIAHRIAAEQITNVRLFPFVPRADYNDLLASADAGLVTLEPGAEGLGVPSKFYSILASGRATVAVVGAGSEVARVVEEAGCGVRVEQGDAAMLARSLLALAASPDAVRQMGENARRVFLENYTLERTAARYLSLFHAAAHVRQEGVCTVSL